MVPQVLIPLAAELAPPERRAGVVAGVQIGLMTGIIGSRVVGGVVGEALGWRSVYLLAAVLTALAGSVRSRPPEFIASLERMTAFGRIGRPDEIVSVVAFLASPEAGWVTGQNIRVNGGAV
ncbi:SDR family oxidoreductase [Actinomadura sp. NTSP31]|uniref:SDR family oxidoreductase n=1 Tax=Actinomadura sp. NTSP31 TaxID=1735447 RepID=UPI0035BFC99C